VDSSFESDFLAPGTPVDLDNCAREPIHLAGAIQPEGVLLCARRADGIVVQASANTEELFGAPVAGVLGRTLGDLLGDGARDLLENAGTSAFPNLRPVRLALGAPRLRTVDAFAYSSAGDLVVVELEYAEGGGAAVFPEFQAQVSSSMAALQRTAGVTELLSTAARVVKELSGFDRVWVYRFEADGHGVVVAEEKEEPIASFLGLHYPEGDIPAQARALFLQNGLRFIADAAATAVPLEPLVNPASGEWLDLSAGVLRAVSPMHIRYLRNMGVRASMSIALAVDGRLWGLISAHHYADRRHVPHAVRAACEFAGLVTSMLLVSKAEIADLGDRRDLEQAEDAVLEQVAKGATIAAGLVASSADLLGVCAAAGAAVRINDELHLVGTTPSEPVIRQLISELSRRDYRDLYVSDSLSADYPEFRETWAAGVLAAPLSRLHGNYVMWFRPEWVRTVTWGQSDAPVVYSEDGQLRLAPRESFERWRQKVEGSARPWSAAQVTAVRSLRSKLGIFLLTRAEQLAEHNAKLAAANAELDAFAFAAGHDLKEPLRGISYHAALLAEDYADALDEDGRDRLHLLSRLSHQMSGLLDSLLAYATLSMFQLKLEECPLAEIAAAAADMLSARIAETGARLVVADGLPAVRADRVQLTEVLTNLIGNAIKYAGDVTPVIEVRVCRLADTREGLSRGRVDAETEPIVVCVADNGIGVSAELREMIFGVFRRLHGGDAYGGGAGLGLAIARRVVQRHGGMIWVKSQPGRGSRFYFTLGD
jgi:chemotaxis family two-component system sensor kinase Cph1